MLLEESGSCRRRKLLDSDSAVRVALTQTMTHRSHQRLKRLAAATKRLVSGRYANPTVQWLHRRRQIVCFSSYSATATLAAAAAAIKLCFVLSPLRTVCRDLHDEIASRTQLRNMDSLHGLLSGMGQTKPISQFSLVSGSQCAALAAASAVSALATILTKP